MSYNTSWVKIRVMVLTRSQSKQSDDSSSEEEYESTSSEEEFESGSDEEQSRPRKKGKLIHVVVELDSSDEEGEEEEDDGSDIEEEEVEDEGPWLTKKERNYLDTLESPQRRHLLTENKRLSEAIDYSTPMRFKIISSSASDRQKSILLKKYEQLQRMNPSSGDFTKYNLWIEAASKLPLGKYSPLKITSSATNEEITKFLETTRKQLDASVYGHKEIKDQILRILAQWIAKPHSKGNVIGIHGAPGLAKTKVIKEGISKALGLPFAFVSLGGAYDGSFLNGHGFTYEGSTYGKIAEILMKAETMNPVIFFDELDKVSAGRRGDEIAGILTHLTDPVQNEKYNDNYFTELDLDLSKSLLVFSYNDESLINPILKDRMITIHVQGYSISDKVQICQKHLLEEVMQEFNIPREHIIMSDEIVKKIIQKVPEEQGVRNLKRGLESIISWINMERYIGAQAITFPLKITEAHVNKYISKNGQSFPLHMYL
jgi:ATP-dependent Lon protease